MSSWPWQSIIRQRGHEASQHEGHEEHEDFVSFYFVCFVCFVFVSFVSSMARLTRRAPIRRSRVFVRLAHGDWRAAAPAGPPGPAVDIKEIVIAGTSS